MAGYTKKELLVAVLVCFLVTDAVILSYDVPERSPAETAPAEKTKAEEKEKRGGKDRSGRKSQKKATATSLIAHRGLTSTGKAENTLAAFRAAGKSSKITGIETDLQNTSDGIIVVYHDKRLDRKTDGTGRISSHKYRYIASRRYYNGARISTFRQYLKICRRYGKTACIELKRLNTRAIRKTCNEIYTCGMQKNAAVISSRKKYLQTFRMYDRKIPAYYIVKGRRVNVNDFTFAKKNKAGIDAQIKYVSRKEITKAKAQKIPYITWSTDSSRKALRMLNKLGVTVSAITANA